MGIVHVDKLHRLAAGLLQAFSRSPMLTIGSATQLPVDVDLATAEVVHNQNVVALIRQVHRTGPAAEAVTAENENLHQNFADGHYIHKVVICR